jgi:hypothetical protein
MQLLELLCVLLAAGASATNRTCVVSIKRSICVHLRRDEGDSRVLGPQVSPGGAAELCHAWCCESAPCAWWSVVSDGEGGRCNRHLRHPLSEATDWQPPWVASDFSKSYGATCSVGVKAGVMSSEWVAWLFSAKGSVAPRSPPRPGGQAAVDLGTASSAAPRAGGAPRWSWARSQWKHAKWERTIFNGRIRTRIASHVSPQQHFQKWAGLQEQGGATATRHSNAHTWHTWWHGTQPRTTIDIMWSYTVFIAVLFGGALVRTQDEEELLDPLLSAHTHRCSDRDIRSLPRCEASECGTCAICLGDYSADEEMVVLPCQHYFHDECIATWLRRKATCPLCNGVVSHVHIGYM